jgi:hypothetical protein
VQEAVNSCAYIENFPRAKDTLLWGFGGKNDVEDAFFVF